MDIPYTILEVDRTQNASWLRRGLGFMQEVRTDVCDARRDYPGCLDRHPHHRHIFDSVTNVGIIGLWVSLLNAFERFLELGHDRFLIFEDDAQLCEGFEGRLGESLAELPEGFSIFSLGYRPLYLDHFSPDMLILGKVRVCRMFQTGDSWGMLYSRRFVERMLADSARHGVLGGFPDTAIIAYARSVGADCYSTRPSFGPLVTQGDFESSLQASPVSGGHIRGYRP
jgi:hypothetical protein